MGTLNEDGTIAFTLAQLLEGASDADVGDTLQISGYVTADNGTVTKEYGTDEWVYTPNPQFNGQDTLRYTIFDGIDGLFVGDSIGLNDALSLLEIQGNDTGFGSSGVQTSRLVDVSSVDDAPVIAGSSNLKGTEDASILSGTLLLEDFDGIDGFDLNTASFEFIKAESSSIEIERAAPNRTSTQWKNEHAFAALNDQGGVVVWGDPEKGGSLGDKASLLSEGVDQIFSGREAFAALKADGSLITWGDPENGGDSSAVADKLTSGVVQVASTRDGGFAALKSDGSIVAWGTGASNTILSNRYFNTYSYATVELAKTKYQQIFSNNGGFAAIAEDGSVYAWSGANRYISSDITNKLQSQVIDIKSVGDTFAAHKS